MADIEEQSYKPLMGVAGMSEFRPFSKYTVIGIVVFLSIIAFTFFRDYQFAEEIDVSKFAPISKVAGTLGKNLILVKIHKTGGSTAAGVVRRIGDHYNLSGVYGEHWIKQEPGIWANHMLFKEMKPKLDLLTHPYHLVTWVRDPMSRCLSNFYFKESRYYRLNHKAIAPITDKRIIAYLKDCTNNQYHYLRKRSGQPLNKTIAMYDLIGITEEFNKALIVLKHQLNLKTRDILWIYQSKDSNTRSNVYAPDIPFKNQTAAVKALLPKFMADNHYDYELYRLAKARLQEMIDLIPNFDQELQQFEEIRSDTQRACNLTAGAYYDCYFSDNGCGYKCMDNFLPLV